MFVVNLRMSAMILLCCAALCRGQGSEFEKLPIWPSSEGQVPKDRYVFRDGFTHEVVIALPLEDGPTSPRKVIRFRLQNQVTPDISVRIVKSPDGRMTYAYTLANSRDARQAIDAWTLFVRGEENDLEVEHPQWKHIGLRGASVGRDIIHPGASAEDAAYWSAYATPGAKIDPAQNLGGFIVKSRQKPGITVASVQGGQPLNTPGDLPLEVARQLTPLMRAGENTRIVATIGPRFASDTDRGTIAADFVAGLKHLVKRGLLKQGEPFYTESLNILESCAKPNTACSSERRAQLKKSAVTDLELAVASAILFAFE